MPSPPPPGAATGSRFYRALRMTVLVPLARLRFVFILGAMGVIIAKWDDLLARYEMYVRTAADAGADPDQEFFCPMHPTVVRDTNKDKCPICFMPLSKRKKGEQSDIALPAGTVSRVQLTPYRVALAGVNTVPVAYHPLTRDLTTVGTVEFDERKLVTVAARVKGRIDTLHVNQTGQMVHVGDRLAELYSPDLVVTVQNLIDARASGNKSLEAVARDRLLLWGIDARQVEEIATAGKPVTHLTIRSPIDGHVLRKAVREGQYVEEGSALFDVADLRNVWVQAQLYEDDIAFLPPGGHDPKTGKPAFELRAAATARAFPGRTFDGTLAFLFPHVDADTRTLTVRFDVPNPDHELRPGMTATVSLRLTPELLARTPAGARLQTRDGKVLAVPEPSVIDTGAQKLVYREALPHTFDGVAVELGSRLHASNGAVFYPVLAGLAEGDRVVTTGSFLIDAETRLNPAVGSIYIGGGGSGSGSRPPPIALRPTTPEDPDAKIAAALAQLSPEDRALAETQRWCPVLGERLGSMDVPVKVDLPGGAVLLCCKGCVKQAKADPDGMYRKVEELKKKAARSAQPALPAPLAKLPPEELAEIRAELARLSPEDRKQAEAQVLCPILDEPLGSMGVPVKLMVNGQTVYVCCKGCDKKVFKDPEGTLRKLAELRKSLSPPPGDQP
jgi:membrane fusion protein, copper/silver efflux system